MKKLSLFTAILLFLFSSCKKETVIDPIIASSEDNAEVSAMFDEVDTETDNVSELKDIMIIDSTTPNGDRKIYVTDTLNGLKKVVISFTNYQNERNTRIKNGKIIILVYGKYADIQNPFKKIITFDDFTINGNKIEGTRTIERDAADSLTYNIKLEDGKVTFIEDNTTYTRTIENRIRKWTAGSSTPYYVGDDEYTIEGSASGTNRKGEAYSHVITSTLHVATSCPWIESGTIEFSVTKSSGIKKTAVINYGAGDCDRDAVVTLNGKDYDIKLRGGQK